MAFAAVGVLRILRVGRSFAGLVFSGWPARALRRGVFGRRFVAIRGIFRLVRARSLTTIAGFAAPAFFLARLLSFSRLSGLSLLLAFSLLAVPRRLIAGAGSLVTLRRIVFFS